MWGPGQLPGLTPPLSRCHILNRPRLSRDYKIDDISLNTHMNRLQFKPHITNMYIVYTIHTFGKNQLLITH